MNERIQELARQAGATDEQGNCAENVFCFTATELSGFTDLVVKECTRTFQLKIDIAKKFGVELQMNYFGVEE